MRHTARMLCCLGLLLLAPSSAFSADILGFQESLKELKQEVFLVGKLTPEDQLTLTTTLAAIHPGQPGIVLFYSDASAPYLRDFLKKHGSKTVHLLGTFAKTRAALEEILDCELVDSERSEEQLWRYIYFWSESVIVCPNEPRSHMLQAAALAGRLRAGLLVYTNDAAGKASLAKRLTRIQKGTRFYAVGDSASLPPGDNIKRLAVEAAVTNLAAQQQGRPIRTLVIANPHDAERGNLSLFAPWIAAQKDAMLLLTNEAGTNVQALVEKAIRDWQCPLDNVILVGNLQGLPMEKRPNPLEGKDKFIEMEPLTPRDREPFSYAVGRLFHEDPAVLSLMLARPRLWKEEQHKALIVGNPGGGLPLLETFSRTTAQEMRNTGFDVTALFGADANEEDVRRLLPRQSIFLWEGHHGTLVNRYAAHTWPEPMQPSLVYLQSCLALCEPEAQPFLQRGAVAVIGSSTRTYSGSGGAMSLAYFDALLYEKQSMGGALRQAKNFMLAFSLLKEKRMGATQLTGANLRSAWAFSLWGDPTLHLPLPKTPDDAQPAVKHRVDGDTIILSVPEAPGTKVQTADFRTQTHANVRLAGLFTRTDDDTKTLVPLLFAEVALPRAPPGKRPVLRSKLSERDYVFCWDARRQRGSLLVRRHSHASGNMRFTIDWQEDADAKNGPR